MWRSRSRAALASWTGTLTSPNESEPFQSARGMSGPALQARLERVEEVRGLLERLRLDAFDLLALRLPVDQVEHGLAVGVLVLLGVEPGVKGVDQLLGDLRLLLAGPLAGDRDVELAGVDDLVVEAHRVEGEHAVERAHRGEVLAIVEGEAADADPLGLLERLAEHPVRLPVVTAADVVGLVEEDRIDLVLGREVLELDHLAARAGGDLDLVLLEDDVLVLGHLEALDHLLVGHLLALLRADAAVLDAGAVAHVDLMEADGLRLRRRVELDRHVREAEADRAVPNRAGHALRVPVGAVGYTA